MRPYFLANICKPFKFWNVWITFLFSWSEFPTKMTLIEQYNSNAPYQTRSWSFCALCFLPTPSCCLPALSNPVLTGELLKTAIGYTVLLPNYQICTVYKVHATYPINHFLSYINVTNALYPCYLFGIKTYVSYVSYVSALCDTFIKLAFQQMEEI